jgi:hypothetical protein
LGLIRIHSPKITKPFFFVSEGPTKSARAGNTKGGSSTVQLTSCLTGLDKSVLQIKTKIVSCHTADSKPVKQQVNGTVILPPSVFPARVFVLGQVSLQASLIFAVKPSGWFVETKA